MKSKKIFSEVLKDLGEGSDLTWKEVAQGTGLSAPALSSYVNGVHYPHDKNHEKIACFFNLTRDELRELEARKLKENVGASLAIVPQPGSAEPDIVDLRMLARPTPATLPEQVAEIKEIWPVFFKLVARLGEIFAKW